MVEFAAAFERHKRTRGAHASETAEDYVEAIDDLCGERGACRVMDLARHFGVTHVTVSKIRKRLVRDGLVRSEETGSLQLTAKGKGLAKQSRRRHQIVLHFLLAIGVTPRMAEIDAEGIEHHVSAETLRKMKKLILAHGNSEG